MDKNIFNIELLFEAMNNINDIVFITNEDAEIIYANKAFELKTGYKDYIGKNPNILRGEKGDTASYEELWENIMNDKSFSMTLCNMKKNGEKFLYEQEISVFTDININKKFYISIGRDVTERKKSKEKVINEISNFEILFNSFSEMLFRLDENYRIISINDSSASNIDEEKDYFKDKKIFDYFDKLKLIYEKDEILNLKHEDELRVKAKNGTSYNINMYLLNSGEKLMELKDITDIVRDEEFLRSTNDILKFQIERKDEEISVEKKKLLNFLNSLNIPIIKLSENFEVSFANNFSRNMFGVQKEDYLHLLNEIISDDIFLLKETYELEEENTISFDTSYRVNNREFYILWTLTGVEGNKSEYFLIGDDITNIKELIKKQEELVSLLQNQTKNIKCLYTISEIGRNNISIPDLIEKSLEYINGLWGRDLDVFLRVNIFNRLYPLQERKGGKLSYIYSIPIVINNIEEGSLDIYSGEASDINEEYRNLFRSINLIIENSISNRIFEDRLLEKQNKLLELQKIAKLGTFEYNIDDNVLEISEETRHILEVSQSIDKFKIQRFLNRLSKEDAKNMSTLLDKLKNKIFEEKISVKYFTYSNKEINLSIHIKSKQDISGKMKLLGTMYEITDLVKIQRELENAKTEAINSNKAKSLFLANMSHEIRTPLNAILGFTQILLNKKDISEENKSKIEIINRSGEHLLSLINDILDISKVEAGKLEIRKERFNLHLILKDIKNMFANRALDNNIEFVVNYKETLPEHFIGDVKKLKQVIVNLLGNSFKFTDEGSIHLNVYNKHLENNRHKIYFIIKDTGVGISEEDVKKIFDKFYQASNSREGTGLGLTITKSIIDALGGEIDVESELYSGTTFKINFEMEAEDEESTDKKESKILPSNINIDENYKNKVLVVDDIIENISLLKSILSEIGIDVYTANNATEALLLFERLNFDLIFMDIKLPDLDGREVIKKMRLFDDKKQPFIIGISASTFKEDIQSVIDSGADDFISKPINLDDIYKILNKYMQIDIIYESEEDEILEGVDNPELACNAEYCPIITREMQIKFFDAIEEGDFFGISDLIDELDDKCEALKAKCKKTLDKFDYEELKNIIMRNTKK